MMKSISASLIAVVSIMVNSNVVQGETMLRVIFNNGVTDPELSCNTEENTLITSVFTAPMNRPRNLRRSNVDDALVDLDQITDFTGEGRYLQRDCKNDCKGYATGYCHVPGCSTYNKGRRQLQHYGKGFLSNSTLCQETANSINSDLDFLVQQGLLSSTCIALLHAPRTLECFEDVMYGIVDAFKVIDADSNTELIPFLNARETICNIPSFNFEVKVNPCVKSVNITLFNVNANFRASVVRKTTAPGTFTLFGMAGNGKKDYLGRALPLGNYTLEATPDGFTNKLRTRNFLIAEC